ncbi:MAG: hypothetical protein NT069_04320 [Planctomycetota bacterium]|nr:hypothetical protein [Planctomycetota bacterium]
MRCFTILVTITTLATQAFAGAHSEEDFEKKKANHADVVSEARESLLKAFDDKIQVARKQKGANAEGRIKATEALEAEQKTFRESGGIPFSPAMRDDAVKYLKNGEPVGDGALQTL